MARAKPIPLGVLMKYFRVPTGDLKIEFPKRAVMLGSRITNISLSGCFVRTQEPLPEGESVTIVFQLPDSDATIRAETTVRWSTARRGGRSSDGVRGMGLEFTTIARRDKKQIERFVRNFLTRMRG